MAKPVDIGSKRLVRLTTIPWVRWLTGDETAQVVDMLPGEFQWMSRANDILLKLSSKRHGQFLLLNEMQLRPDPNMPLRIRAYAGLAEEHFHLPIYPVVINILPPTTKDPILNQYHSEFMGILAHQDYQVINLWEVDANIVFEQGLTTLLPFVPILKGGEKEQVVRQAVRELRANETLAEFESLLALFATFVLRLEKVVELMRWDMTILRESPWVGDIWKEAEEGGMQKGLQQGLQQGLEQGLEKGLEKGMEEMVLLYLVQRFGNLPPQLVTRIEALTPTELRPFAQFVFAASSLTAVSDYLTTHHPNN